MLPPPFEAPALALRLGTDKLIRKRDPSGWSELGFDLATDPGEQRPRPLGTPALLAGLDAYRSSVATLREQLRERAASPWLPPAPVQLDPEREQTLRALGYIE